MAEDLIRFVDLSAQYTGVKEEILARIRVMLESGDFVLGREVEEFESNFSRYCGTTYAVGVANGTDALMLSLRACGVGPGDEVITAPNSFIATAGAIVAAGAMPIFVDVREDYNIDPDLIEQSMTQRTRAIIPVHIAGRPAAMDELVSIGTRHNIPIIEDAAQAVGSTYKGRMVGTLGTLACFSLHPLKNLGCCGDGGVITTNDRGIYTTLVQLRNHGLRNRDECDGWGYNSRLDTIQAIILNIKLRTIDVVRTRLDQIVRRYREGLRGVVQVPEDKEYERPLYHNFIIEVERRDELMEYLRKDGIESKIHYPIPIHLQRAAQQFGEPSKTCPVTECQVKRILSLPLYPELTDEQVDRVIWAVATFMKKQKAKT